ncbi:hypothetical protein MR818_12205 [bacterium]|nr:hypothetical protein [bacterium]
MEEKFQYRIGLDIGITSVGWAVLQNNSQDEPVRITDLGVRIFDVAENPKNGDALAAPRRDARTTRRRLRRRRHRLERIKFLLQPFKRIRSIRRRNQRIAVSFPSKVSESIAQGNEKDTAIFRRWFDL